MKFIIALVILSFSFIHTIGQDIIDYDKLHEKYEQLIQPKFLDTVSIDHLIFKKFGKYMVNVKKLTLTIDLDKHGYPVKADYYEDDSINFNQRMFEEIKKFIFDNCRWKPAYGITYKGKKERTPYLLEFVWELEYYK